MKFRFSQVWRFCPPPCRDIIPFHDMGTKAWFRRPIVFSSWILLLSAKKKVAFERSIFHRYSSDWGWNLNADQWKNPNVFGFITHSLFLLHWGQQKRMSQFSVNNRKDREKKIKKRNQDHQKTEALFMSDNEKELSQMIPWADLSKYIFSIYRWQSMEAEICR